MTNPSVSKSLWHGDKLPSDIFNNREILTGVFPHFSLPILISSQWHPFSQPSHLVSLVIYPATYCHVNSNSITWHCATWGPVMSRHVNVIITTGIFHSEKPVYNDKGCQIRHQNWVRLAQCTETDLKKSQICPIWANLTKFWCQIWHPLSL